MGFKSFTDEQAALLGYVKAPDQWVKVVYKFPIGLRISSFFYRLWVRVRYGIRSCPMWWAQDEPNILVESMEIGWTGERMSQAEEFVPPSIGTPPAPVLGDGPMPSLQACRDGEDSLKRYIEIAERFQGEQRPTKLGGPEERPNPHVRDGSPGGMLGSV